jgi:hypothetical protein
MATGQTYGPAGMGSTGIASLNQPKSTPRENYIAWSNQGHPDQLHDNKINRIISESQAKQDKWENLGGPGYIIPNPKGPNIRFDAFPTFNNKNKISPGWMEAGITNSNLGGAKVMNAVSGPFKGGYPLPGMDWLEKKLFGDPEDKQGPPVNNEGNLLPGWELHQDGWHYFPPNEGDGEDTPIRDKFFEEMDIPYTLEADLKLQDVMDAHDALGLDLNTDRFRRRANNAGVQVTGMGDSWQYLQQQMDELDRDSPNYEDQKELLESDMDMKYPWMQMAELTQDQMNMMGNPLNTPDFGVSKEDLWNRTKDMEDQGFFGWGAQEPTTQEEFEDYYRRLQEGSVGNWVT